MFKDLPAAARRLVRHHSKLPLPLLKIRAHPQPLKDNMMIRHLCTRSVRPGACSDISVSAMGEVGGDSKPTPSLLSKSMAVAFLLL